MPPEIEAKVKPLLEQIAQLACERSKKCCSGLGLEPRTNCDSYATNAILMGAQARLGPNDPSTYDFHYNEALAKVCLDEIKKQVNDCIVDESTETTWWKACTGVLLINPKTDPPLECIFQEHCTLDPAPGEVCYEDSCYPEVVVATGESCRSDQDPTSFPTCGPTDVCSPDGLCRPRAQPGESCVNSDEGCVDGYGCVTTCVERMPDGTPCTTDNNCLLGAYCIQNDASSTATVCITTRYPGEPCDYERQCTGSGSHCTNGICKPTVLELCELPPK